MGKPSVPPIPKTLAINANNVFTIGVNRQDIHLSTFYFCGMNTSKSLKFLVLTLCMGALFACQEEEPYANTAPIKPTLFGKWHLINKATTFFDNSADWETGIGNESFKKGKITYNFYENGTVIIGSDSVPNTHSDTFHFEKIADSVIFSNPKTNHKTQTLLILRNTKNVLLLENTLRYPDLDSNVKIQYYFDR